MTWHLKDKDLEQKLIELCPYFIGALQTAVFVRGSSEKYVSVDFIREKDGETIEGHCLPFWMDELEEIKEYDPNKWNDYPSVTPPERQLMMFHGEDKFGRIYIGSAVFISGCWLIPNTSGITKSSMTYLGCEMGFGYLSSGQFKPWEES